MSTLTCKKQAGSFNPGTAGSSGAFYGNFLIYNNHSSSVTFTCTFNDSSTSREIIRDVSTIPANETGYLICGHLNDGDSFVITNDGDQSVVHDYTYGKSDSTGVTVDTMIINDGNYQTISDGNNYSGAKNFFIVNNRGSSETLTLQYHDGSVTCIAQIKTVGVGSNGDLKTMPLAAGQWAKLKASDGSADCQIIITYKTN